MLGGHRGSFARTGAHGSECCIRVSGLPRPCVDGVCACQRGDRYFNANVQAATDDVKLWVLDRTALKLTMMEDVIETRQRRIEFLINVPILGTSRVHGTLRWCLCSAYRVSPRSTSHRA